ncbi:hypothetical protein CHARACLAT_020021 [Characodon lateralis]|uniref:Uncharacterized protein n=1 Tax=Characodon lateralis TaxID=208331 RepID=A0ABU7DBH4_9TELE|nr:hypothetical protein [Characodon lateralis]
MECKDWSEKRTESKNNHLALKSDSPVTECNNSCMMDMNWDKTTHIKTGWVEGVWCGGPELDNKHIREKGLQHHQLKDLVVFSRIWEFSSSTINSQQFSREEKRNEPKSAQQK